MDELPNVMHDVEVGFDFIVMMSSGLTNDGYSGRYCSKNALSLFLVFASLEKSSRATMELVKSGFFFFFSLSIFWRLKV